MKIAAWQLGGRRSKLIFCLALFIITCVVPSNALQQRSDQEIVRQARQSYYSLKSQGLTELRCIVQPDWDSMNKVLHADIVQTVQVLPILKGTHFTVLLGPDGASTILPEPDIAPPSEEIARRFRQSVGFMHGMLTRFLQTWSNFMFSPILPEPDSVYHLENLGKKYGLSFDKKGARVAVILNHELGIEEVKGWPTLDVTLHPHWSPSSNGLILTGYKTSYKLAKNQPAAEESVKVKYEQVEGLSLPSIVDMELPISVNSTGFPESMFIPPMRLVFLNYQVKKR